MSQIPGWVSGWLGVSDRRAAERAWRAAAAQAQPGEVWTVQYSARRHVSWTTGPIGLMHVQDGQVKMLGEELLPERPRPLGPFTGLLPSRYRLRLFPGAGRVPGLLPTATGADLERVRAGARVMTEHQDPAFPGLRLIDDGHAGPVRTLHGQRGRHIGDTWVPLAHVVGLRGGGPGEGAPGRSADRPAAGGTCGQAWITADGGPTAEGRP